MALLDRERNLIVLRVVYDGPPEAGKTTSLRALAGSLGQPLYSPAEQNGRTLYFDWMDYTGGRFEGYQIRCQIVSVPGQRELAARRRRLLREADVIVFVADSTREHVAPTLGILRELPGIMDDVSPPAVGVILQANKRDLPDAVPMADLRAELRNAGLSLGLVESVASDGTGIRETFVFAVRLALDRVREQLRAHSLPEGRPEVDSGAALLEAMQREVESGPSPSERPLAAPAILQVLAENDARIAEIAPWRDEAQAGVAEGGGPWPPDPSAPSGAIWPPVEGRVILHEAASTRMTTHRLKNGSWAAGIGNGWRTYSSGGAVFPDLEAGRQTLIQWARLHVACGDVLSPSRCIVLAATGGGTWRMWQIVRAERSLRDHLDSLGRLPTAEAARRILDVASILAEMSARLASAPCQLRCSLDTIGRSERGPIYIALMPMDRGGAPAATMKPTELIGAELESIVSNTLFDRRSEVLAVLAQAPRAGAGVLDQLLSAPR